MNVLLVVGVFLFICCMHINQIRAKLVGTVNDDYLITYYDGEDFKGEHDTRNLTLGLCIDLTIFDKLISSINTHGNCVKIYKDFGCQGEYRLVRPGSEGHNNLGAIDFNDRTSSLSRCCQILILKIVKNVVYKINGFEMNKCRF